VRLAQGLRYSVHRAGNISRLDAEEPAAMDAMRILVVDDEPAMREVLEMRLSEWGYEVIVAATGAEARALAERERPDAVISDVVLPELSGLELLQSLTSGDQGRPVILVTAYGTIDEAVEAMKLGAYDFLTKPLEYAKLHATLAALAKDIERRGQMRKLETTLRRGGGVGELVGRSAKMREVFRLVEAVAASDASMIVCGESGTGKELVARAVHDLSQRAHGPFVAVNVAAIPEGLAESELFGHEKGAFSGAVAARSGCFELANTGTLFLDEIAEMPAALQTKLLRVLEGGTVRRVGGMRELHFDVRVIAATNRDPQHAVDRGILRQDLFYRLNVFTVSLPPLREREGDVPLLLQHFVRQFNAKHGTQVEGAGRDAERVLRAYAWPGNVRELRNVIERAVILARSGWIEPHHLPAFLQGTESQPSDGIVIPAGVTAAEAERVLILETLKRVGNNKAQAARQLGMDVKTIRNKLKAYGSGPVSK
jgi:DNA-binding NtrC family response regulator